jgi:hypothetical protein
MVPGSMQTLSAQEKTMAIDAAQHPMLVCCGMRRTLYLFIISSLSRFGGKM